MRVLLIAYRFPPQTGGGVPRPTKFAKYLSQLGVDVTVLTIDTEGLRGLNEALLADLPAAVKIVRVKERGLLARLRNLRPPRNGAEAIAHRALISLRWWLHQWSVPDEVQGFASAVADAAGHSDVARADVVITTGGPWSSFVAGERLARALRVPLVLDYRDPWTTGPPGWPFAPSFRGRLLNRGIERSVARRASAILSAHAILPELLEAQLKIENLASICHWIPNGYDEADFHGLDPAPYDKFTLTYAGSLYAGRSVRPIAKALDDLVREGAIAREDLRLRVLGAHASKVSGEVSDLSIAKQVEAPGELPHREALLELMKSTICVLVDIHYGERNVHTPGKLYEYLRAGRPILAVSPPGVTADLVRESNGGWVVAPEDAPALASTLRQAYADWKAGRPLPVPRLEVAERFERSRSAARVKGILEELLASRPARGRAA